MEEREQGIIKLTMEKSDGTKVMDNELYEAAVNGNPAILASATVSGDECTETKANILHIAVSHEQNNFIEIALWKFPHLICRKNLDNNTPFHIAAETGNTRTLELLVNCYKKAAPEGLIPWTVKNSEGNTPLHVALICANLQFAEQLVMMDPELTGFVNHYGEAPLHLAVRYPVTDDDRKLVVAAMKLVIVGSLGGISTVRSPPKESSTDVIQLLLKKNPSIACLRDSNGLTPLLRVALFKTPDISAIESILKYCPQSIDVCDSSGKSFLHLLSKHSDRDNREYLFSITKLIGSLKDRQDFEGNTPAHLAAKNCNIFMVRFLAQVYANFAIKNKEGISAADLLQQQSVEFRNLLIEKQGENLVNPWSRIEEEDNRLQSLLSKLQEREIIDDQLPSGVDSRRGNVLHQLIDILRYNMVNGKRPLEDDDVQEFIRQALDSNPALICETNKRGETPLHQIAHFFPDFIDESVLRMFDYYFKRFEDKNDVEGLYLPPWRMKDVDGDTPLHTALICGARLRCLCEFLKFDSDLVEYQNNEEQTPLHLLSAVNLSRRSCEEMKVMRYYNAISSAASLRDQNGLTPLLKAAEEANILLVSLAYILAPESEACTTHGDRKTFWHLLAKQTGLFDTTMSRNLSLDHLRQMIPHTDSAWDNLAEADADGNTPLHIAIEKGNFHFAQFILEIAAEDRFKRITSKRNNKDFTPIDLIGYTEYVPREFENFIWSKPELMKVLLGVRSLYGIPTSMVKDYANTIGVIAALLATITFTAAFTVPGGLNTDNGTPILLRKVTFQAFMVSDILAMSLSMMILFCLLWTMGNQKERVVILDLTIFLLQLSFYATLVAFMTGLYVTTFPVASWVAILACTLCSLLILLMHECVVTSAIGPIIKIAFASRKAASSFRDFLYLLLCWVPKRGMICCSRQPSELHKLHDEKLKLNVHEHELWMTWRPDGYFCDGCGMYGPNWSFYCEECDFGLHPECALKNVEGGIGDAASELAAQEKNHMLCWSPKRGMICCSQQPDHESVRSSTEHGDSPTDQVAAPPPKWRAGYLPLTPGDHRSQ